MSENPTIGDRARREPQCKLFTLPKGCDVAKVAVRELLVKDDLDVAERTERLIPQALRTSVYAQHQLRRREQVRQAIVAIMRDDDNGVEMVDLGNGFVEFDEWTNTTYDAVFACFIEMNGTTSEDFLKGAVVVSGPELAAMRAPSPR